MIATLNGIITILNYYYVFFTRMWYFSDFMRYLGTVSYSLFVLCVFFISVLFKFVVPYSAGIDSAFHHLLFDFET